MCVYSSINLIPVNNLRTDITNDFVAWLVVGWHESSMSIKRESQGSEFWIWTHSCRHGAAGWVRWCLKSHPHTQQVVHYPLHSCCLFCVTKPFCERRFTCEQREQSLFVLWEMRQVIDLDKVSLVGNQWCEPGWGARGLQARTRKYLTPSHFRTLWHTPNLFLYFLSCLLFLWGFCCRGDYVDSPSAKHLFKVK